LRQAALANVNLEHWHKTHELAGVAFERGFAGEELAAAENHFGFTFPPDLRQLLSFALPTGRGFPTWRRIDRETAGQASWSYLYRVLGFYTLPE
jgi:hypothetical protein